MADLTDDMIEAGARALWECSLADEPKAPAWEFADAKDQAEIRECVHATFDAVHQLIRTNAEVGANEPDYMKTYWERWASLIEPGGVFNRDQAARELFDYGVVMGEASKVYEELAGLSKPNTAAVHILDGAERRYAQTYADYLCDRAVQAYSDGDRDLAGVLRELAEEWDCGAWHRHERAREATARVRAQLGQPETCPPDVAERIDKAIAEASAPDPTVQKGQQ